jgi:hypothetical protein
MPPKRNGDWKNFVRWFDSLSRNNFFSQKMLSDLEYVKKILIKKLPNHFHEMLDENMMVICIQSYNMPFWKELLDDFFENHLSQGKKNIEGIDELIQKLEKDLEKGYSELAKGSERYSQLFNEYTKKYGPGFNDKNPTNSKYNEEAHREFNSITRDESGNLKPEYRTSWFELSQFEEKINNKIGELEKMKILIQFNQKYIEYRDQITMLENIVHRVLDFKKNKNEAIKNIEQEIELEKQKIEELNKGLTAVKVKLSDDTDKIENDESISNKQVKETLISKLNHKAKEEKAMFYKRRTTAEKDLKKLETIKQNFHVLYDFGEREQNIIVFENAESRIKKAILDTINEIDGLIRDINREMYANLHPDANNDTKIEVDTMKSLTSISDLEKLEKEEKDGNIQSIPEKEKIRATLQQNELKKENEQRSIVVVKLRKKINLISQKNKPKSDGNQLGPSAAAAAVAVSTHQPQQSKTRGKKPHGKPSNHQGGINYYIHKLEKLEKKIIKLARIL